MEKFVLQPKVSIHPGYIAVFKQPLWFDAQSKPKRKKKFIPTSKSCKGLVSNRSAAKLKDKINWLLLIAKEKEVSLNNSDNRWKFRLSFVTLTLASKQIHSDNEIKAVCLNQFLIEAGKKWGIKNYLWRAESQENENIHFHILSDKFVPWSELRDCWNRIQNKLGYVDRYRDEMRRFHAGGFNVRQDLLKTWSYKNQLRAYRTGCKNDWNSPNSTDVHSVVNIRNLPAYLSKYCTKNKPGREIKGRIWGLSQSLSCLVGIVEEIDSNISDELNVICKRYKDKVIQHDYYTIILVSVYLWATYLKGNLYTLFRNYIFDIRNSSG
jgi:hypothetical protein